MKTYRTVLCTPGVAALMILGFLARIPFSTLGLLLTLHTVTALHQTYLAAGFVVTASTLGTAISSPWRGRVVDSRGLRRAVVPSIIIQSATLIAAAFVSYWPLLILAFVGGLFALPVFAIVRTSLSVMVPATLRRSAFALDSVVTEFVFMIGPAMITVAALSIGTRWALVIVGASVALAGIGLAIANPPTRADQVVLPTRLPGPLQAMEEGALGRTDLLSEKRVADDLTTGAIPVIDPDTRASARRSLLTLGGLSVLIGTATASMILTATDVSIVALLRDAGAAGMIGPIITIWCAGSAIGGLSYGAMTRQFPSLWVVGALGALTIPIALVHSVPMVAAAMFVAGLACAPAITATGEEISHRVPEEARGEAMGYHGSAMTIGGAVGGPVIGAVIDAAGASAGIGLAGVIGVVVAAIGIVAMTLRRRAMRARLTARFSG